MVVEGNYILQMFLKCFNTVFCGPYVILSIGCVADFRSRIDVKFTLGIRIGLKFDKIYF